MKKESIVAVALICLVVSLVVFVLEPEKQRRIKWREQQVEYAREHYHETVQYFYSNNYTVIEDTPRKCVRIPKSSDFIELVGVFNVTVVFTYVNANYDLYYVWFIYEAIIYRYEYLLKG